jgi:hypothetical protein
MHDTLASRWPHGWVGGEGEGLVVLYVVGFGGGVGQLAQ